MRILLASIVALVVSHGASVNAEALLIDINRAGSGTTATAAEFTAAGVAEDLTGVAVTGINVVSDQGSGFSGGGITFSFSSNYAASYDVSVTASNANPSGNSLLDSYVYFSNTSANSGPADVTLSGLSVLLDANTDYKLYLFGTAGLNTNQNSEFTFPLAGMTKTTKVPGALSDSSVSFDFSTGGTADNTLAFHWSGIGSNQFAVFNGLAITPAVPEPAIVPFDIKPGSELNSVNLGSKGVLPVAILSTTDFDAHDVDIDTLLFGDPLLLDNGGTAVSPLRYAYEDVSDDGLMDLTLKFSMPELVDYDALGPDTLEGLLTGSLLDGTLIEGMDSIRIVPSNGFNKNSLLLAVSVPEPSAFVLSAIGLLGLAARAQRSRSRK